MALEWLRLWSMMMSSDFGVAEAIAQRGYATFHRRFNGLLVDVAILIASFAGVIILVTVVDLDLIAKVAIGLAVAGLILYDPVLVSGRGGTIGHYRLNMRVVDANTGARIGLLRAVLRSWIKAFFGVFAFFFMLVTRRHQALHDLASRSSVIIHDLDEVDARDVLYERSQPEARVPRWRRLAAIVAYSAAFFTMYSVASLMVLTPDCVYSDICTSGDDLAANVFGWAMILTFGVVMVLGWRGKLPGAREHNAAQPVDP
jgi:uncharacterized RDD family membrane protein YckC